MTTITPCRLHRRLTRGRVLTRHRRIASSSDRVAAPLSAAAAGWHRRERAFGVGSASGRLRSAGQTHCDFRGTRLGATAMEMGGITMWCRSLSK